MQFYVLIDYDNIEISDQSKGLVYIAERIINQLDPEEVATKNIIIRFYCGWYENKNMTTRAQKVSTAIHHDFPFNTYLSDNKTQVIVGAQLATSLILKPSSVLVNTFRRNGFPFGLRAKHPTEISCHQENCTVMNVYKFVEKQQCSQCNHAKPEDIFYRQEQKLVDTMLTVDMITIAKQELKYCIVSSDDDFWPGILASTVLGCIVYHFHTKRGRQTPAHYRKIVSQNYFMKTL